MNKTLAEHLALYGIRHFASEDYWPWAARKLGEEKALKLDELREWVTRPGAKNYPEKIKEFYDSASRPEIAPVIHSMKADAIRASGEAVSRKIAGRKNILDLGCGIGCLTTWYAGLEQDRRVTGIDCHDLIWGLGSIHCVTQQQPAV